MRVQLVVAFVVEAFDGRFLNRAVHSLGLTVRRRMVGFHKPVFDVVSFADHVETHLTRQGSVTLVRRCRQTGCRYRS
jgi:hypothetical protein